MVKLDAPRDDVDHFGKRSNLKIIVISNPIIIRTLVGWLCYHYSRQKLCKIKVRIRMQARFQNFILEFKKILKNLLKKYYKRN